MRFGWWGEVALMVLTVGLIFAVCEIDRRVMERRGKS